MCLFLPWRLRFFFLYKHVCSPSVFFYSIISSESYFIGLTKIHGSYANFISFLNIISLWKYYNSFLNIVINLSWFFHNYFALCELYFFHILCLLFFHLHIRDFEMRITKNTNKMSNIYVLKTYDQLSKFKLRPIPWDTYCFWFFIWLV